MHGIEQYNSKIQGLLGVRNIKPFLELHVSALHRYVV